MRDSAPSLLDSTSSLAASEPELAVPDPELALPADDAVAAPPNDGDAPPSDADGQSSADDRASGETEIAGAVGELREASTPRAPAAWQFVETFAPDLAELVADIDFTADGDDVELPLTAADSESDTPDEQARAAVEDSLPALPVSPAQPASVGQPLSPASARGQPLSPASRTRIAGVALSTRPAGASLPARPRIASGTLPPAPAGKRLDLAANVPSRADVAQEQTSRAQQPDEQPLGVEAAAQGSKPPAQQLMVEDQVNKLASSNLASSTLASSTLASSNLASSNLASSPVASSNLASSTLASSTLASSNLASSTNRADVQGNPKVRTAALWTRGALLAGREEPASLVMPTNATNATNATTPPTNAMSTKPVNAPMTSSMGATPTTNATDAMPPTNASGVTPTTNATDAKPTASMSTARANATDAKPLAPSRATKPVATKLISKQAAANAPAGTAGSRGASTPSAPAPSGATPTQSPVATSGSRKANGATMFVAGETAPADKRGAGQAVSDEQRGDAEQAGSNDADAEQAGDEEAADAELRVRSQALEGATTPAELEAAGATETARIEQQVQAQEQRQQVRGQRRAARTQARQGRATRRGTSARAAAQQRAQRRTQARQQKQGTTLAALRQQFATQKQQQLQRIATLQEDGKRVAIAEATRIYDQEMQTISDERAATVASIDTARSTLQGEIARGKQDAERTRQAKEQELVRDHQARVTEARTLEQQQIGEARTYGTQAAAALREQGASEGRELRATAKVEADELRATGRQLAAQASSAGGDDKDAQAEGRARAQAITREYAGKAAQRQERGEADARRKQEEFAGLAEEELGRMRDAIAQHQQRTRDAIAQLDQGLDKDKQGLVSDALQWTQTLELQLQEAETRFTRELQVADEHAAASKLVTDKERTTRIADALRALQNDHERLQAEVTKNVEGKLAEMQARLDGATEKDVAAIHKDLAGAWDAIGKEVGRITEGMTSELRAYDKAAAARSERVKVKAQEARDGVATIVASARKNLARTAGVQTDKMDRRVQWGRSRSETVVDNLRDDLQFTTSQAMAPDEAARVQRQKDVARRDRADADMEKAWELDLGRWDDARIARNQTEWRELDTQSAERHRVTDDEAYRLRRLEKTGEVEITTENAFGNRVSLKAATNGFNNTSALMQSLATRSPEELKLLFSDGEWTAELYGELRDGERALIEQMRAAKTPEQIKAIALKWAADGGSGIGTDTEVMKRVFAATTNAAERSRLDTSFATVDATRNREGRTIEQLIEDEQKPWLVGSGSEAELLKAQYRGDETEIAAFETIDAYRGGWFGTGADMDRVFKARDAIRKKYAGPFATDEEAAEAKRKETEALSTLSTTVEKQTGKTLAQLDAEETTGVERQALDATNQGAANWDVFASNVAQSGVNTYDTRRIELAYANKTPTERRAINQDFQQRTGVTFEAYVNQRLGVTEVADEQGNTTEITDSRAKVDRRAAVQMSRDGRLDDATLMLQSQFGKGRSAEDDRKAMQARLATLSDEELAKLKTDYAGLVDESGMKQAEWLTGYRRYLDLSLDPNMRAANWAQTQILDSVSGPTGDLTYDLRSTATRNEYAEMSDTLSFGRVDTPKEQIERARRLATRLGATPEANSYQQWQEGWEGRQARKQLAQLEQQYRELEANGLANVTTADARSELQRQVDAGTLTSEQMQTRLASLEAFTQTDERASTARNATLEARAATTNVIATVAGVTVGVVAGIGLTAISGGAAGPVVVAMFSAFMGGATTIAIKATQADVYERADFVVDAMSTIVDVVTAGLLPGDAVTTYAKHALRKLPSRMAQEILAGVIREVGTNSLQELAKVVTDPRMYQGSPEDIRKRFVQRMRNAATSAAINGGVSTAATEAVKRGGTLRSGIDPDDVELDRVTSTAINTGGAVLGTYPTATSENDVLLAAYKPLLAGAITPAKRETPAADEQPSRKQPTLVIDEDGAPQPVKLAANDEPEAPKQPTRSDEPEAPKQPKLLTDGSEKPRNLPMVIEQEPVLPKRSEEPEAPKQPKLLTDGSEKPRNLPMVIEQEPEAPTRSDAPEVPTVPKPTLDKRGFQTDDDGRIETDAGYFLDGNGKQVNQHQQLVNDAGTLVDESGAALTLDQLSARYPTMWKPLPSLDAGGLALEQSGAVGMNNAGVFTGESNGTPVFVKALKALDANEVALTQRLGELGLGPRLLGTTNIDGKLALVTERIDNGVQIDRNTTMMSADAEAYRGLSREQRASIVTQIEAMGPVLQKSGIDVGDLQFLYDPASGKVNIIDPGQFQQQPAGQEAPFAKTELDAFAKSLRQTWKL